jgi:hypothetical protein
MLDNRVGLAANEPAIVDVDENTIFVGENSGFTTGDEVTYDNGGGTSIGNLTDDGGNARYYVIDAGGGMIKLASSLLNAQAGIAVDLTSQGVGDTHKIDRAAGDDITFDPGAKRVELALTRGVAWVTGEAVVYDNGGGTNITGLASGSAYYVIANGGSQIKLAATQEKALKGEAIVLAPGGGVGGTGSIADGSSSRLRREGYLRYGRRLGRARGRAGHHCQFDRYPRRAGYR